MKRRILIGAIVAFVSVSAFAQDGLPMLLRPPFPAGLIPPKPERFPRVWVPHSPALGGQGHHVACLLVEVATDGSVTQVIVLSSSGDPFTDGTAAATFAGAKYDPATLNGVPIAVRLIAQFDIKSWSIGTSEDPPQVCSWAIYDAIHEKRRGKDSPTQN